MGLSLTNLDSINEMRPGDIMYSEEEPGGTLQGSYDKQMNRLKITILEYKPNINIKVTGYELIIIAGLNKEIRIKFLEKTLEDMEEGLKYTNDVCKNLKEDIKSIDIDFNACYLYNDT